VISRSRSATPYADGRNGVTQDVNVGAARIRKPSLNRLASVAVMETLPSSSTNGSSIVSKQRAAQQSGSSIHEIVGAPGLKDVLKIPSYSSEHQFGMNDLLPPSPSVATASMKAFIPSASHLHVQFTAPSASPTASHGPGAASTGTAGGRTSPLHTYAAGAGPDYRTGFGLHARSGSAVEPPIRPLDFRALMASHEEMHAELGRIVDDLAQWLVVTEGGLTRLLEGASEERIDEEGEEPAALDADGELGERVQRVAPVP